MLTRSLLQKKAMTPKIERNWYADAKRLKAEGLATSGGCLPSVITTTGPGGQQFSTHSG